MSFYQAQSVTVATAVTALIIPGLGGSGPQHWQSIWEARRTDCRRVEQENWTDPNVFDWVWRLQDAVEASRRPVVLVAHSLGCILVAQWASVYGSRFDARIAGALLVAPCDVEQPGIRPELARFLPLPKAGLPFPSVVVASSNDPYSTTDRSRALALRWGSRFIDIGACGHINADSGLGAWACGQTLLDELLARGPGAAAEDVSRPQAVVAVSECEIARGTRSLT